MKCKEHFKQAPSILFYHNQHGIRKCPPFTSIQITELGSAQHMARQFSDITSHIEGNVARRVRHAQIFNDQFIRPPVRSNGRTYTMLVLFFLFFRHAFSEFPRPIALKLCHLIGICVYFITRVQKLRGHSPKKIRGPKTCKISVDFGPLQTLIVNISGTSQGIQNRKTLQTMAIPPALRKKVR